MIENNTEPFTNQDVKKHPIMDKISYFIYGVIIIIIFILIGLFINFKIFTQRPQFVYKNITNKIFENAKNIYNNKKFDDKKYISGNVNFNTNNQNLKILNNEKLNYSFGWDLSNKKAEIDLKLEENNSKFLTLLGEVKNNNLYLQLNELYNKTILVDNTTLKNEYNINFDELFESLNNAKTDSSDILFIIDEFHKISDNIINELEFEKTEEVININGKDVKTIRMDLPFNLKNQKIIGQTFTNKILGNKELLQKLSNVTKISVDELKNNLLSYRKEIDLLEESEEIMVLSINLQGLLNKIVKVSYNGEDNQYFSFVNTKDYKSIKCYDTLFEVIKKDLIIKENDKIIAKGIVNSFEFNNLDITFKSVSGDNVEGKIKYINNENDKTLVIEYNYSNQVIINVDFNNLEINENESSNELKIKLNINNEEYEIINKMSIVNNKEIATNNNAIFINVNDLTENDIYIIQKRLENKFSNSNLNTLFNTNNSEEYY